jgi:hypothetical protein
MKRHSIALVIQPYKNRLLKQGELREMIDRFSDQLLAIASEYPNIHFNVVLPGYILELINPLLLSRLRELQKRNALEWLLTGYSEPSLSFSPGWVAAANIKLGMEIFTELTGCPPAGFVPPFANWEPSYCTVVRPLGLSYAVLSHAIWPQKARRVCGYWYTEQGGDGVALFPSHVLHHYSAPADLIDWLEKIIMHDESGISGERLITIQYLLSLQAEGGIDAYRKLKYIVAELDKHILRFQPLLMQEARSQRPPVGLQHLPPSLPLSHFADEQEPHFFGNLLHSYDQVGILQRKMMEISDQIAGIKDSRQAAALKRRLFLLQDINRFLPARASGFTMLPDRMWSFAGCIDLEKQCRDPEEGKSGRIHITDFLRNGNKSIIMSNRALKAYCDNRNGGRIFELDYLDRNLNLFAAYNPAPHDPPEIVSPGTSYAAFIDRIYAEGTTADRFIAGAVTDAGDFSTGAFEYSIKKTSSGIKMALNRQGSFVLGEKTVPLSIEKVFGMEKDEASLSFVYQALNHSLTNYSFVFTTELPISLPGVTDHALRLVHANTVYTTIGWEPIVIEKAVRWSISDHATGVRIQIVTQKPVDVCCLPIKGADGQIDPSCGIRLIIASPVTIEASSSWSLIGNLSLRKIRERRKVDDAL